MRILVVIANDLYVRNFVGTGAFAALAGHDLSFVSGSVRDPSPLAQAGRYLGAMELEPWRTRWYVRLMYLSMFSHRGRSSTLRIKTQRMFPLRERVWHELLAAPSIRTLVRAAALWRTRHQPRADELIDRAAPDLIIAPSSVTDPLLIDVVRAARRRGVPTLFLINGWDNLSSKMVFAAPPDHLAVWGEQSREHALRIHDIGPERVSVIGAPMFERYRRAEQAAPPYPFRYAVFAGCALPFDELSALRELDAAVDRLGLDLTIVYRPHPWRHRRRCADVFEPGQYRHVVLDEQMRSHYASTTAAGDYRTQKQFMPALDYYPGLLRHAAFVVSPLSTVMLESAACGTPVLALAYDDDIHPYSPGTAFHEEHFQGLGEVPGFCLCRTQASLGEVFVTMARECLAPGGGIRPSLDGPLRRCLSTDERTYAQRLRELVDRLGGGAAGQADAQREAVAEAVS